MYRNHIITNTTTTTQIQRNPRTLILEKGEDRKLVLRRGKPIGVYISLDLYEKKIADKSRHSEGIDLRMPKSIQDKWAKVDPVEYQRQLRDE